MISGLKLNTMRSDPEPATAAAFKMSVRVYYEDTDAGGIVYYANYLRFMERCRSDWLRDLGYEISAIDQQFGIFLAVRSTQTEYLKPARLSDLLTVTVNLAELRRASMRLGQQVYRNAELLCHSTIRLVCLNAATLGPMAIPEPLFSDINKWKMP
jgi:acyl-CoA thioester hydrolase